MPLSGRVLPLYTTRLVTVPVAHKQNLDHFPRTSCFADLCGVMPSYAKLLVPLGKPHFRPKIKKLGKSRHISAVNGSQFVVENSESYYRKMSP